jgi:hypothetical protein
MKTIIALGGIPNKVQVGDMGVDGMSATTSLTQTLSPRRGLSRSSRLWKYGQRDWPDGLEGKRKRAPAVPSPGGEGQGEGGLKHKLESFFKRSHKVIVALTVQEILDEQIAKLV